MSKLETVKETGAKKGDMVIFVYNQDDKKYKGSFTVGEKYTVRVSAKKNTRPSNLFATNNLLIKEDDRGSETNGHRREYFVLAQELTVEEIIESM